MYIRHPRPSIGQYHHPSISWHIDWHFHCVLADTQSSVGWYIDRMSVDTWTDTLSMSQQMRPSTSRLLYRPIYQPTLDRVSANTRWTCRLIFGWHRSSMLVNTPPTVQLAVCQSVIYQSSVGDLLRIFRASFCSMSHFSNFLGLLHHFSNGAVPMNYEKYNQIFSLAGTTWIHG